MPRELLTRVLDAIIDDVSQRISDDDYARAKALLTAGIDMREVLSPYFTPRELALVDAILTYAT